MDFSSILIDIIFFLVFLFVGTILVKWLVQRKGWDDSYKTAFIFTLIWNSIDLGINLFMDFFFEYLFVVAELNVHIIIIIFIITSIITLSIVLVISTLFFKILYKREIWESFVVVIINILIKWLLGFLLSQIYLVPPFV